MDIMALTNYVRPELIVLIAILYCIGVAIKKTESLPDCSIPFVLSGISIIICGIYIFAVADTPKNYHEILIIIFDIIVQGICTAAVAVYIHQIQKQGKEIKALSSEESD